MSRSESSALVQVLIAADRRGHVFSRLACRHATQLESFDLQRLMQPEHLVRPIIFTAAQGWLGSVGVLARRLDCGFRDARPWAHARPLQLAHVRTVRAYADRLNRWMDRFHGVATRYLDNYLAWHRMVDRVVRLAAPKMALRWPLSGHFP